MKKIILSLSLTLISMSVFAQKPLYKTTIVKVNGKEREMLTLSQGRYVEVFTNDTLWRVGSTVFNSVTDKIEYFIEKEDSMNWVRINRPNESGRWLSTDPLQAKYPEMSPYNFAENNPIYFNDPTGKDAEVTINGNDVLISAKIYIYGSGASASQAQQMQNAIMGDWNNNGKGWTYTDKSSGQVYNVKFNVSVELYDKENPTNNPDVIPDAWNPFSTNNYIEIGATKPEVVVSEVFGGDEGLWRGYGTDPSSHEFGHLIGLLDRYDKVTKKPLPGWEGNVMGEPAEEGVVQQKNIDAIISNVINEYKESEQYEFNNGSTNSTWIYQSKIDETKVGWESCEE